MAYTTIAALSDALIATQRELNDVTVTLQSQDSRIAGNTTDISALQNPPAGVPSDLMAWFAASHTITEVDTLLDTTISDLDSRISDHDTDIATITSNLATETTNRTNADIALSASISDLQTQITNNLATLTQEITDRATLSASMATQYITLNTRIDGIQTDISNLATTTGTDSASANSQLSTINSSLQTIQTQIQQLQNIGVDPLGAQASQITALTIAVNDTTSGLANEVSARIAADLSLQNAINALNTSFVGVQTGLSDEISDRMSADSVMQSSINTLNATVSGHTGLISAETAARIAADSALNTTVSGHTTQISDNTTAIGNEVTNRTNADTALQSQITTNTGNITTNTNNISTNNADITAIKSRFGIVTDGGGYVTQYRRIDQVPLGADFKIRNLNNDARLQNPGYVGKYFAPVAMAAFSPAVSYSTAWGGGTTNDFHGTDGNDYTRNVLVYATASVGTNGSVFKGVDFSTGGDLQRLGQVLTTFRVDFSGGVNRYLSVWYRVKPTIGASTGRWFPVALADNTMSGQRTYEQTRGQAVVQISVTADQVIEFGLTSLNTLNANIADPTKDFIYGGSVSVTALNMVTIS